MLHIGFFSEQAANCNGTMIFLGVDGSEVEITHSSDACGEKGYDWKGEKVVGIVKDFIRNGRKRIIEWP
jgi:hypothetical protein